MHHEMACCGSWRLQAVEMRPVTPTPAFVTIVIRVALVTLHIDKACPSDANNNHSSPFLASSGDGVDGPFSSGAFSRPLCPSNISQLS